MKPYGHSGAASGVRAYEYGPGWIRVQFQDGSLYKYTAQSVGRHHLKQMKLHADAGRGLSTYISTHPKVREGYVRKRQR